MLPPIEDSLFQNNPKFAALHTTLTNNILNPSGSTKNHPAQKERDAVTESVKTARVRAAKLHLLRTALSSLDLSASSGTSSSTTTKSKSKSDSKQANPLPTDLLELVLLLSARVSPTNPTLSPSQTALLTSTETWALLPTYLPQISSLISTHLQNQTLALARIISPSTNSSFLHRAIPKLPSSVAQLKADIAEKKQDLGFRRTALVGKTTTVLGVYHVAAAQVIRILEQSKHGSVSRFYKTKAEYLGMSAKQVELELKEKLGKGEKMVYTEEVKSALEHYVRNLRDGRERLRERKKDAERILWGYGVGREEGDKERRMREIARVYGELVKEVAEVGRDVERLRGR